MSKFLFTLMLLCSTTAMAANVVPVLLYHNITEDTLGPTQISRYRFDQQITFLKKEKYNTITISQLADMINGKGPIPDKTVAITFDDGLDSQLLASKTLFVNDMSATFYIITGMLDHSGYMKTSDVFALSRYDIFEIGAHTQTHFVDFVHNLDELSTERMNREVKVSKIELEMITQRPVNSLSWPYGYYTPAALEFASKVFTSIVTVKNGGNDQHTSPMEIRRLTVDGRCSQEQFQQMLISMKDPVCQ